MLGAIKSAIQSGEIITIAYAYGSRRGQERSVIIKEISNDASSIIVNEQNGPACLKTYIVQRIMWLTNGAGIKIENKNTISEFNSFKRQQSQKETEVQEAIENVTSGAIDKFDLASSIHLEKIIKGRLNGAPKDYYKLKSASGREASIAANNAHGAIIIIQALTVMSEYGSRSLWELFSAFLNSGCIWPDWYLYQIAAHKEGSVLRGKRKRLRDINKADFPDGITMSQMYHLNADYYSASKIRPLAVDIEGRYFDRVRFFEGLTPYPAPMWKLSKLLSPSAMKVYMLETKESGRLQVSLPNEQINAAHMKELLKAGVLIPAEDAPFDVLMDVISQSMLYEPIKKLKRGKPETYDIKGYVKYYQIQTDDELERLLRTSNSLKDVYILQPPATWGWEEFQDFRCTYIEMFHTLHDWLNDIDLLQEMNSRFTKL